MKKIFLFQPLVASAILLVAGLLIYGNTFSVPFVFDDKPNILDNPFIRMTELSPEQIIRIKNSPSPRPFANFTFALNYYFHQYRPFGYHLANILIHIINAMLVFLITGHTLRLRQTESRLKTSLAAALLWLAHPLHTQSVTYIVQRMNALAAMFFLLAVFCYIQARLIASTPDHSRAKKVGLFIGCGLAGVLSVASKPNAATLPFVLFLYEWFFFQGLNTSWIKKQSGWLAMSIGVFLIIAVIYLGISPVEKISGDYTTKNFTSIQRLLTEPRVVFYYLSLLAFPHPGRLQLIYDITPSTTLSTPLTTGIALFTLAVLSAAAVTLARRNRLLAFAVCWYLVCLSIESSVLGLALAFEHRTYLPSVFPVIAVTHFFFKYTSGRKTALVMAGLVICLLGFWAHERNRIWSNEISLWKDSASKAPHNPDPLNGLGLACRNNGRYQQARQYLGKALEINPLRTITDYSNAIDSYTNLCLTEADCDNYDSAINYGEQAKQISATVYGPDSLQAAKSYNNLGVAHKKRGDIAQAILYYQKALEVRLKILGPDHPFTTDVYYNLASAYKKRMDHPMVIHYLNKIITAQQNMSADPSPYDAVLYYNLGDSYYMTESYHKAIQAYSTALKIHADNLPEVFKGINPLDNDSNTIDSVDQLHIYANLGVSYHRTGNINQAIQYYRKSLIMNRQAGSTNLPDAADTCYNMGLAYTDINKPAEAITCFRQALSLYKMTLGKNHARVQQTQATVDWLVRYLQNKNAVKIPAEKKSDRTGHP